MANRDIIAIGTSAGGVAALLQITQSLPANLPAAVLITIHLPKDFRSVLDELLARAGKLRASFAKDSEELLPGQIYIAPPDRHLLLESDRIRLGIGPRENNARPAIDPMLRSVALCCGPRSIGVVLTGTLGDGASGLQAISRCGGMTVVQDPRDAAFPEMPENAMRLVSPDHLVKLAELPKLLESLVHEPAGEKIQAPENIKYEVNIAKTGLSDMDKMDRIGKRSLLACPDCHGVMWEMEEGDLLRFRCHVGHAYTGERMTMEVNEGLRRALGSALRALDEKVELARRLQRQAADRGHRLAAQSWAEKKQEYERERDVVRKAAFRMETMAGDAAE